MMSDYFQKVSHIDKPIVSLKFDKLKTIIVCECGNETEKYIDLSHSAYDFICLICGNEYFGPVLRGVKY